MDEFGSLAGVIALWIGVSCGLWWLHRRSVHARQRRQMRQAARATVYTGDAQKIFDAIRDFPRSSGAALSEETHALLKRVQARSAFFDKVNALRVDMLAGFGMDDYPPLSEILHIRRDLWAASEIVLVEDLSSFGESFAEPGAYERLRAEAAALLFKAGGSGAADEDVIDLRLSLARGEAERFVPELKDAIRLARERDRLPSFAEIIAYPIAAIRAVPAKIGVARGFLAEFYRYAAEIAGAIRRSEAMERGVGELRRAQEELPRRLVTGFERASATARQSASGLRQHYDFLVTAHDFQAKYEQALRRAPQITERGRQFIARLELAERSERLRLTSANVLIWLARQLATGLAHFIAGLQTMQAALSETPPGALAALLVAPTPVRGRHLPAFRSYQMALGASGLSEQRPRRPNMQEDGFVAKHAKAQTSKTASVAKGKPAAAARKSIKAAKAAKQPDAPVAKSAARVEPAAVIAKATAVKPGGKSDIRPLPGPSADHAAVTGPDVVHTAASPPPVAAPAAKEAPKQPKRGAKPARLQPPEPIPALRGLGSEPAAPATAAEPDSRSAKRTAKRHAEPIVARPSPPAPAEPAAAEPVAAALPPPAKRRSLLDRLLGRRPAEPTIGDLLAAAWEREHAAEASDTAAPPTPSETAPTLLGKLSELPNEDLAEAIAEDDDTPDELGEDETDADDADDDDPESLTSSVMEVQTRLAAKAPQIRSFPWLRG